MLFILFLFSAIFGGLIFKLNYDNNKLKQKLNTVLTTTYATPIKELTSNFREFVEAVDGKISPEVEAAIKKLETDEVRTPIEPPNRQIREDLPPSKVINKDQLFTSKTWKLFLDELNDTYFDDDKINVIKHWGKMFRFTLEQQSRTIKEMYFDDDKAVIRKYFEKEHNERN